MLDRSTLMIAAWAHARRAAKRLGGTARAHFGDCLKLAWLVARRRLYLAVATAAVATVTPVAAQENPMPETVTAIPAVPAYTAENTLRAAFGPHDAMESYFDAHNSTATVLLLGQLLDFNGALPANLRAGMFRSVEEYDGFIRSLVARFFRVDPATLAHIKAMDA